MLKSNQINIESIDFDRINPYSLYYIAMAFKEIAISREEFDLIREGTWLLSSLDDMLALALASYIVETYEKESAGFFQEDFRGLCNTVRFLYDFSHVRFDGEKYWFSPDKTILARLKDSNCK